MKEKLETLVTETRNLNTFNLSQLTPLEIVEVMHNEDYNVLAAINNSKHLIAKAISLGQKTLLNGGRIIYIGAGTSGRLGILDAVECPPTFGVDYNVVVGLMAGGLEAFVKAKEGAEDSLELAEKDLKNINFNQQDLLVGLAASGRTPYVIGGLKYARFINAKTVSISCNPNSLISDYADCAIEAVVGPEVLTGSTRLKAGTVQKIILNMISTGSMIGIGKVYENLMIDVKPTNHKLVNRAINIIKTITNVNDDVAKKVLKEAEFNVKLAIIMLKHNISVITAKNMLLELNGNIGNINENN